MDAVFLDTASMGTDLDFDALSQSVNNIKYYDHTEVDQVVERLKNVEVAIVNKVILDADIIAQSPHLKLICVVATGTNNIDLSAAEKHQVRVCNAIQYGRSALVQHNFALLLSLASNLPAYISDVRNGKWQQAQQFCLMDHPILELSGKTMGIIGYGDLGQGMAEMARAFGMEVLIANRQSSDQREGRTPLQEMLAAVDVLSIHCLLSEETRNLITLRELKQMKSSAFLLNTARGGIVNEADLLTAIQSKTIAGAGIDVLSEEPPINGNPLLEVQLPNLLVTPHCAWASQEARQRILDITCDSIHRFENNNLERWVV